MSIKNLFNNNKKSKIISSNTIQSASVEVEGVEFVKNKSKEKKKFVPPLDYATASNFAKFGSAKLYYEYGFKRIHQQYPYDGTLAEKQAYENSGSYLDNYIFDNLYPRTNGYVNFNILTDGKITGGTVDTDGYYNNANNKEYIKVLGGPHTASGGMTGLKYHDTFDESTLYDPTNKRENNLKLDLNVGNTIEFWLKKTGYDDALGHKEVIFELTDQENQNLQIFASSSSGATVGALCIMFESASASPVIASLTEATFTKDNLADGNWHHYAITMKKQTSTTVNTKLYIDSQLHKEQNVVFSAYSEITSSQKGLLGVIGAKASTIGDGQLFSASVDEFRFWKSERNGKQIGQNWFTPIGGGTDDSLDNIDLGVYFKFNEGITLTASTDSTILDYSGRLSNGTFVGYHADTRDTGSAIVDSGIVTSEFKDPIIYSYHPDVVSKLAELTATGSIQDYENPSLFYHLMPSWIIEEDKENGNSNLEYLSQIIASYFDTLNAQIAYSSKIKDKRYYGPTINKDKLTDETSVTFSGSMKPLPFANRLLREQGFVLPELFVDADIVQEFREYDQNQIYERDLSEVRNLIYQNLYNNLTNIYKSKGTEKAFRNYLKCFGLNSDLIKLNLYADGATYTLKDNYELKALDTRMLNFDHENNHEATVFQNSGSGDFDYIKGDVSTNTMYSAFSIETEVIIPQKLKEDHPSYTNKSFTTSSIFGFHQIDAASADNNLFQDKDIKILLASTADREESKFILSGSDSLLLETDVIKNLYSNTKWNLVLRVNSSKYPYSSLNGAGTPTVDIDFYGIEMLNGNINRTVSLSSANITDGQHYLTSSKKVFVGAERENFTGSVINRSDIKVGDVKYWQSYITNEELKQHALDLDNYGLQNPYMSDDIDVLATQHIPKIDTLAFHWNFNQNTTTDVNTEMQVIDISSGSAALANRYSWMSQITKKRYHGLARGFPASSTDVIEKTYVSTAKKKSPSSAYTSDMIKIVGNEEKNFFQDDDVSDNFYSFEKSMQAVITDDMLNMFASIKDFNNLIGNPINKYRPNYKELQSLKSLYFEHIENEPDQERFFEFYKWIDSSISFGINQLIPASSRFSEGVKNTIESHVLERNKYQHKFPLVSQKMSTEGAVRSVNELKYNWQYGHAPDYKTGDNLHCTWLKKRMERSTTTAEIVRKRINTNTKVENKILAKVDGTRYSLEDDLEKTTARIHELGMIQKNTIHGGINYRNNKNRQYYLDAAHIHGNINSEGVPENILAVGVGTAHGIQTQDICNDNIDSIVKNYWDFKTIVGKNSNTTGDHPLDDAFTYKSLIKGHYAFPFNLVSGTIASGYNAHVSESYRHDVVLTNLHSDTTYFSNDVPMQGPFTERHVGGLQSRHQPINKYDSTKTTTNKLDNTLTRAESFKILIGEHPDESIDDGAFGLTGPDYGGPYPDKTQPFAIRFRNQRAKQPVSLRNIQHNTSSNIAGNYNKNYEFFSAVGRKENNFRFRSIEDQVNFVEPTLKAALPHTNINASLIAQKTGEDGNVLSSNSNRFDDNVKSHLTPELSTVEDNKPTKSIITQKFSAPGGFETMSRIFLDAVDGERSAYNALPFRNLSVRSSGSGEVIYREQTRNSKAIRCPASTEVASNSGYLEATLSGMPNSGGFSVSFWVKLDTVSTNWRHVYHDNTRGAGTTAGMLYFQGGKIWWRNTTDSTSWQAQWDITYSDLQSWKHLVLTWDGSITGNGKFYINGVEQTTGYVKVNGAGNRLAITEFLLFDKKEVGSDSDSFELEGALQDFAFWNKQIADDEVVEIYNNGNYKDYSTLSFFGNVLAHFTLGETSPSVASLSNGDTIPASSVIKVLNKDNGVSNTNFVAAEDNLRITNGAYDITTVSYYDYYNRVNSHSNRREGLKTLLTRPCGKFGIDSQYGTVTAEAYTTEASFQKQHRNNRYSVSSSTEGYNPISDNAFVSTQIPATDFQYNWTSKVCKNEFGPTGSSGESPHYTHRYGNKTGKVIINNQVDNVINYPVSSSILTH